MANIDEEWARFEAEIASVEATAAAEDVPETTQAAPQDPAPSQGRTPPKLPPPLAPPKLAPPPLLPPPAAAAAAGAPAYQQTPNPAAMYGSYYNQAGGSQQHLYQQQHMQMMGAPQGMYQQLGMMQHQQQQQQMGAPPGLMHQGGPAAAVAGTGGGGGAGGPGGSMARPADEATLRKLKEDLLQQTKDKKKEKKPLVRTAAGQKWVDPTLVEWPENDHRIFVGDLGNEVNDELLSKTFSKYASFAKAKVVRDKRTNKSKGFGFVSFLDVNDFAKAMREMNGKYIGNRPCKLRKSTWDERTATPVGKRKRAEGQQSSGPHGPKKKYHIPIAQKFLQKH